MQQMSNLLTASDLTIARRAAYSSLSCDVGQACNSTVYQLQAAMLRAALTLGLFGTDSLSPLLPAEAWGVTLESSCVDGGVQLILPEPVVRLDGSAPTAALFHPTLDGDAAVLKATALVGPRRIGGSTVYVLSLDMNPLPSGGKSLSLRIEEATLVAPLRGPMPKMTLSTPLADCSDPRVVSVTALPIYGSGSLEQEGWGAAVRATVGLRIVFSKDVASRAEDGTLSPLDAASFHVETPNGTEVILGVRMSTSPGARRARRGLLRAEEYTSEAVILLGLSFTPDVNESVRLSVLEGRVIDQQGNVVASGRLAVWANLHPVLPTDLECPWLGGLLASALMAALALLELSLRMLPKEIRISRRFPATRLKQAHSRHQRVRHSHWPSSRSKYLASAPMAEPTALPPPELRWWRQARTSTSSVSNISSIDSCTSSIGSSTSSSSSGHRLDLDPLTRARLGSSSAAVGFYKPKLSTVVWIASVGGSVCLFALASARQVTFAQTVVPLLPVWFAQSFLLSSQCGQRQSGLAILPALRTLGVCAMSIAVAIVTAIPSATDLSPSRRLMVVGPTAVVAALLIAVDAVFSRRPFCCASKKRTAPSSAEVTGGASGGFRRSDSERLHKATRLVWMVAAKEVIVANRFANASGGQRPGIKVASVQAKESDSQSPQQTLVIPCAGIGVSPPPSPPGQPYQVSLTRVVERQTSASKAIAKAIAKRGCRRSSAPSRSCPRPRRSLLRCCYILPFSRLACRNMLRALGLEAWGSLALLAAVVATVVGVPPFAFDDGATFSCHSIGVSVSGTITLLLAPLLLGLLRRVRRTSASDGLGAGQGVELNVSLVAQKQSDRTTAIPSLRLCRMTPPPAQKLAAPVDACVEPDMGVETYRSMDPESARGAKGAQSAQGDFLQDRMSVPAPLSCRLSIGSDRRPSLPLVVRDLSDRRPSLPQSVKDLSDRKPSLPPIVRDRPSLPNDVLQIL